MNRGLGKWHKLYLYWYISVSGNKNKQKNKNKYKEKKHYITVQTLIGKVNKC